MTQITQKPEDRCDSVVRHFAHETPDAIALIEQDDTWTYKSLNSAIERCASGLIKAGVNPGDRVATLSAPTADFVITFLAAISVGAIWQGLNPRYQKEEIAYAIGDAQPKLIFTPNEADGRAYLDELRDTVSRFDWEVQLVDMNEGLDSFSSSVDPSAVLVRRELLSELDPAIIVYTSGSTGKPKGALLTNKAIVSMSLMQNEVWPVSPLVGLNFLPINHVGNIVDTTMPVFTAGGTMVLMSQFDPDGSIELMEKHGVTVWGSIPSVFHLQLACERYKTADLSAVKLIVWEGAAMPVDTIHELKQTCTLMATNYGMTETTSAVTILKPTDDLEVLANSVGSAVPGVEIRLADASDKSVSDGEAGEIQTRSMYNTVGYWRRDDATKGAFTDDGFFKTGDLAKRRTDGRYQIVGRLKEMFKSGGYNVYPREIEEVLESHDSIAAAAVVGADHPVWGEAGVAFVLATRDVTKAKLEALMREHLANYKIPKKIEFIAEMPLLPIGKIDKKVLKTQADALFQSAE